MARSYLAAALATGIVIGYVISRIEAHCEINAITESMQHSREVDARPDDDATKATATLMRTLFQATPAIDDLERAARRLDERARTADRLGDPKLADLWRAEAQKLRDTHRQRTTNVASVPSAQH